jgi:CRP-like cAMP-binding protein
MSTRSDLAVPPANRLLRALPTKEYRRLLPKLTQVTLTRGQILYERGDTIRHVYFPNNSIISLVSMVAEQSTLEVGMVGNEGMAGLSVFMGIDKANTRELVQGGGSAVRMEAATLRKISHQDSSLRTLLLRYTYSLLTQISQSAACNLFHTSDARLARWLLMASDRMSANEFRLTQDVLSRLLGMRRESVNKAASALQKEKIIDYSRGVIAILDRDGLEKGSCTCYARMRESDIFWNPTDPKN